MSASCIACQVNKMGGGKKLPNAKKALKRTTNKAERQALKDQKKSGNLKTKAERLAEITSLKEQIGKWQITPDFEPVAQLFEAMDTFVETGEAARGVIPFLGKLAQYLGVLLTGS